MGLTTAKRLRRKCQRGAGESSVPAVLRRRSAAKSVETNPVRTWRLCIQICSGIAAAEADWGGYAGADCRGGLGRDEVDWVDDGEMAAAEMLAKGWEVFVASRAAAAEWCEKRGN